MKIAVGSAGKDIDSKVSEVFARCPYFIVAEVEDGKIQKTEAVENIAVNQMGQAGISAAQLIAEKDVKAVITGNVGPRAAETLKQFNVVIYYGAGSVKEVLQGFIEGKLKEIK